MEGVVRDPSLLGITTASPCSITATQLLVVPRSMPMTFPNPLPSRSFADGRGPARPPPPWPAGAAVRGASRPARAGATTVPAIDPGDGTVASASCSAGIEELAERAPAARRRGGASASSTCRSTIRTPSASGSPGGAAASARSRLSTAGSRSFTTGPAAFRAASSRSRATRLRKFSRSAAVRSSRSCSAASSALEPLSPRRPGRAPGGSTSTGGSPPGAAAACPLVPGDALQRLLQDGGGDVRGKAPFFSGSGHGWFAGRVAAA